LLFKMSTGKKISSKISQAWNWVFASFDAQSKGGMSGRKITAFVLTYCVIGLHSKHGTNENATTFLMYDLIGIALLLGIVTVEQLIRAKNGSKGEPDSSVTKTSTTETTDTTVNNPPS